MERERSNQVSDLYQRALAHAPADRERFVREPGGDEALRQEVESLLRFETVSSNSWNAPPSHSRRSLRLIRASVIGRTLVPTR